MISHDRRRTDEHFLHDLARVPDSQGVDVCLAGIPALYSLYLRAKHSLKK